jgi:preprotein translocase subunit SecB
MSIENKFKFIDYRVTKLNYSQNQAFKKKSGSNGIEIAPDFTVTYKKNDSTVFVDLSIKFENVNTPFFLTVVLTGVFELEFEISDEEIDRLANINLAAILFPFLRQVVADTTVKAGFAPLLLPPTNFSKEYISKQSTKVKSLE